MAGRRLFGKTLALAGAVFLLWAVPAGAAEEDIRAYEERIFRSFAAGDYYALYDSIEAMLLRFPAAPEAALYFSDLGTLSDLHGFARVDGVFTRVIAGLDAENAPNANLYRLLILIEREKLARRFAPLKAIEDAKLLHPVRHWMVSGPYYQFGAADLEYPFLPEIASPEAGNEARWKKAVADEKTGEVDFKRILYPERGVAYATTTLSPGSPVRLRVYSPCAYRLFINGREAVANIDAGIRRSVRVIEAKAEGNITIVMKLYADDDWRFRLIVTDMNDRPVPLKGSSDRPATGPCEFMEVLDYPYDLLVGRLYSGVPGASFHLGSYFRERDSREAVKHFRKGKSSEGGYPSRYFLAESLLESAESDKSSAEYVEAARIYHDLCETDSSFIPAQYRRLQIMTGRRAMAEAYAVGRSLVRRAPFFLPLREAYSMLLSELGYEKEFEEDIALFAKEFPSSPAPRKGLAAHNRWNDPALAARQYREILGKGFDRTSFETLIDICRDMERHGDIIALVDEHDRFDDYGRERIDALIDIGEYERASRLLLERVAVKEDPEDYLRLGRIGYLEGEVPSPDWGRMLAIAPSYYKMGDLLDFLAGGGFEPPMARDREEKGEDHAASWIRGKKKGTGVPSEVIYRGRIYRLNADGSSRAFCEDVIYIHDSRGIERYGEFRLEHGNRVYPVRARVYREDGSYSDAGRIIRVDGTSYLSLPSLGERSVIHVAYYADNPFDLRGSSRIFATPIAAIHDFDEALGVFSCRVIAPEDMDVKIVYTGGEVTHRRRNGMIEYLMRSESHKPVRMERAMGNRLQYLPLYSISTMRNRKEFAIWYNGLVRDAFSLPDDDIRTKFAGGSVDEAARRIYAFVSREIDLLGNVLYYPEKAATTMMKRRGTPEDKAVLARAMLECLGIRSYFAFTGGRDFPDLRGFVSPGIFSHVLLYVPIDRRGGVWIDFSQANNGYGVVGPEIEGTEALVILRDKAETRTVTSLRMSGSRIGMKVQIDNRGNAFFNGSIRFYGARGEVRSLFQDAQSREEMVNRLLAQMFPAFSLDDFKLAGLEAADSPLELAVKGRVFSISAVAPDRIVISPVLNSSEVLNHVDDRNRKHLFHIVRPVNESESYSFVLPEEYRGAVLEREDVVRCRFGYAMIRVSKRPGSIELDVDKEVHVNAVCIDPADYGEFVDFSTAVQQAEQRHVIIEKPR
ncbi:MAG TPA: hypothetical protein VLM75_06780 [Spirochaetota bacterium]|nr:hypothetical protein [Spirochaetota bacterium]